METPEQVSAALEAARHEIVQLQRQLELARAALEEFTYSVSHDLRAPLRHVGSYLKIVQEDLGPGATPAILGHLQTAGDAAAQMGRMMDALQELSRAGRAELQPGAVDLQLLIADARRQLEHDEAARPPVAWSVAPDIPAVRGDMALLGRMLVQLLANALKFTRPSAAPAIDIGWNPQKDGWCELWVRDNGVGFDPRFQDRLFRVFQRVHSGKQFEGMGVGLAFARLVVERHGGSIRAQGEPDRGCLVSLTLPLAGA